MLCGGWGGVGRVCNWPLRLEHAWLSLITEYIRNDCYRLLEYYEEFRYLMSCTLITLMKVTPHVSLISRYNEPRHKGDQIK